MRKSSMITVSRQLTKIPATVRPTLQAAIRAVKHLAPNADEIAFQMEAPRSSRMMWKIVRYAVDGTNVVGIGTFTKHSTLFL
jgi:hypothetical protein